VHAGRTLKTLSHTTERLLDTIWTFVEKTKILVYCECQEFIYVLQLLFNHNKLLLLSTPSTRIPTLPIFFHS
ncbi:hypothetical protein, partial [Bacillus smithii]|uniref:hypothetical protein n=1 Tax=Bacillus smithii TaxID=1479 RepID=UPI003D22EFEC